MAHRKPKSRKQQFQPDMEDTKTHIMTAGKELLLAAHGALKFCKGYVEATMPRESSANLVTFFQKAIGVAEELGRGISGVSTLKSTTDKLARPFFDTISREMRQACCLSHARKKCCPGKKAPKKHR